MLNINKLAIKAAKNVCDKYKFQNKRLYKEYCDALARIKTAVGNEFNLEYTEKDEYGNFFLYFTDSNKNWCKIVFREYTEKEVAKAFSKAYAAALDVNMLCYETHIMAD